VHHLKTPVIRRKFAAFDTSRNDNLEKNYGSPQIGTRNEFKIANFSFLGEKLIDFALSKGTNRSTIAT
jgi:hypothetical protein